MIDQFKQSVLKGIRRELSRAGIKNRVADDFILLFATDVMVPANVLTKDGKELFGGPMGHILAEKIKEKNIASVKVGVFHVNDLDAIRLVAMVGKCGLQKE